MEYKDKNVPKKKSVFAIEKIIYSESSITYKNSIFITEFVQIYIIVTEIRGKIILQILNFCNTIL